MKKEPHTPPMLGKGKKRIKKSFDRPPSKLVNKQLGGTGVKQTSIEQPNFGGNDPVGFIQNTPKKATGAMMGRAPPPPLIAKTSTRSDSRKQFKKAGGRKVF
jgi:hypothetical protein